MEYTTFTTTTVRYRRIQQLLQIHLKLLMALHLLAVRQRVLVVDKVLFVKPRGLHLILPLLDFLLLRIPMERGSFRREAGRMSVKPVLIRLVNFS